MPKARAHFRREIHILSRFQHPHAVAYYDASTAGTFWGWDALAANKVINNGDTVTVAAGGIVVQQ